MQNVFEGIRVIDFTQNAAGPYATALLADFGAEVIKVEKPVAGDDMRAYSPLVDGVGMPYFWANRGKKSVVLDMGDAEGVNIAKKLIADADLVVESYRPGTMEKFGLGYEELKKINPDIILCSVSAFGQTGPYRNKPGYDIIGQALCGVMDMTGDPEGPPTKSGFVIADYFSGISAYGAIVTALYHRNKTGIGQHIDIALLDCMVSLNNYIEHSNAGITPTRSGNHHKNLAPFGVYDGNQGYVIIGAPNPKLWKLLCELMGREDLIDAPGFKTNTERADNLEQLINVIEVWLKTFSNVEEPIEMLEKAGIPCAKVNTVQDIIKDEHLRARNMLIEIETPDDVTSMKKFIGRGNPLKFSHIKPSIKKPPALGQHQDEILQSIGYANDEISRLKSKWSIS